MAAHPVSDLRLPPRKWAHAGERQLLARVARSALVRDGGQLALSLVFELVRPRHYGLAGDRRAADRSRDAGDESAGARGEHRGCTAGRACRIGHVKSIGFAVAYIDEGGAGLLMSQIATGTYIAWRSGTP